MKPAVNRKLVLDTSACSRIATSPHRKDIEAHLDSKFRRVVSVPTFWELLHQIEGGDGSHFCDDREVIKVAAGTKRSLMMLPNPLSFAVENVLKRPRLSAPISPEGFKKMHKVIMKARTRDELYSGVHLVNGARQVTCFDPAIVRRQQEEGEDSHVERLRWMKQTKLPSLSASDWARAMVKNNIQVALTDQQAAEFGNRLDAAHQFDMQVWNAATARNSQYNPEKHRNDWIDMQQTIYLCDPTIHLMTADQPLCRKVSGSHQSHRVLYLLDYLEKHGLTL